MDRDAFEQRKRTSVGHLLIRAARLFDERARARIRAQGVDVRPAHVALFAHIDFAGTRPSEIARRAGITKQAVGQLVDELEEAGLLRREVDPDDARARRVRFTRRGERALEHGLGMLESVELKLRDKLGEAALTRLRRDLARLADALG